MWHARYLYRGWKPTLRNALSIFHQSLTQKWPSIKMHRKSIYHTHTGSIAEKLVSKRLPKHYSFNFFLCQHSHVWYLRGVHQLPGLLWEWWGRPLRCHYATSIQKEEKKELCYCNPSVQPLPLPWYYCHCLIIIVLWFNQQILSLVIRYSASINGILQCALGGQKLYNGGEKKETFWVECGLNADLV